MERFANRDVCDITISDYVTGKPVMYINYANANSVEMTGEAVYAYGGHNHVKRVTFQGERAGTLTLETQMQTFELYQLITGGTLSSSANFFKREELVCTSGELILAAAPVDGSVNVYAAADDCGEAIEATVSDKVVTVTGGTDGAAYIVYYLANLDGVKALSIGANNFPADVRIDGETFMKTEDGKIKSYKLVAWKAAVQPNINWGFSSTGDPATLTITFDLMPDSKNGDRILDLIMDEG